MSDRRYTAIFGAAVLTAGVATFSVYRMLRLAAEPQREPTRAVVLVAADVPAGATVPREALTQVLWPERVAPPEAVASLDSVAGRVARVALARGEPVRATALAPAGAPPGLEGTIAPDRRAIAVRVGEAVGVSGLVRPNSRVDVLVTARGGDGASTARLVMSDVRVLGVGSARPADAKAADGKEPMSPALASIVTLEVTPAQAAQLASAEGQGVVQVVLRGFGSRAPAPGSPEAVADAGLMPPLPGGVVGAEFPAGLPSATAVTFNTARGVPAVPPASTGPAAPAAATAPARGGFFAATSAGPRRPAARPAPAAVATAGATARPAAPESVTVHVYRGGQMTTLRVEASAPPAPPTRTAALGGA